MRRAASRPHIASSSPITSNISTMRCGDTSATTVPRRGCISTMPAEASWNSASRSGVRDTSKRCASSTSSRRMPGGKLPVAMPSSISSRTCSERVVALRSTAFGSVRVSGGLGVLTVSATYANFIPGRIPRSGRDNRTRC